MEPDSGRCKHARTRQAIDPGPGAGSAAGPLPGRRDPGLDAAEGRGDHGRRPGRRPDRHARRRLRRERGEAEVACAISTGRPPRCIRYVLDHDYAWADGLICGGKMVIVSQPIRGPEPLAYFRALERAIEQGDGFTEAVVVNPEHARRRGAGRSLPVRRRRTTRSPAGRPRPSCERPDLGAPAARRPPQAESRRGRRASCRACRGSGW